MSKISAPGRYPDLSMDDYHSDCCDAPSLSSSSINTLLSECPAIFWETSPLNPNRVPEESTPSFDIGRAAHALVLGEPEFAKHFVISPYDDFRTKDARAWRDSETRTVLKNEAFEAVKAMADAQRRSPQVARAFIDGKPEQSLILKDAATGMWLKSRPDWMPNKIAHGFVIDYKSCRTILPRKLSSDVFGYGYHVQAALQFDLTAAVTGETPVGVAHVCQEKKPPYLAELRMFSPEHLEFGRREYRRGLELFARCWEAHLAGKPLREAWPGYTTDPQYFETPRWIAAEMENDDEHDYSGSPRPSRQYSGADYLAVG